VQASGSLVSGATTNSVTLISVVAADAGTYTVTVGATGACAAVTANSSNAVLVVATPPTISTHPTSRTVCEGLPTTFTVAAAGTPAPTIYQWQVSSNAGVSWTNLTTGGSFTSSFTIPAVTVAMNGNLYRVIVTNSCGQTITSNNATLTVNAKPIVTAVALPTRICLTNNTAIPLVGSPAGGTWSGVGVSGSTFIASNTSVGIYTLTYTYTNPAGCTATATITANVVADGADCNEIRLLRDDAVILYPNPNDGKFNIRINSSIYGFLGMQVYSSSGQLVHKQSFNQLVFGQVIPIDLTKLPSGPYMVRFYYDGGARTSEKTFPVIIGRQ
jgi:Secretion system C-terminal sorting domain/Immunoglobulin domain